MKLEIKPRISCCDETTSFDLLLLRSSICDMWYTCTKDVFRPFFADILHARPLLDSILSLSFSEMR